MKIIYRYLVKELLTPFLFGVAVFAGIFIGTSLLFQLTEYYNKWGVDLLTLIQLFFLNLPGIIVLAFPMATLLAVIMGFGRLSVDNEITALRAGGLSIYRLVMPALIIGLLVTGMTIIINEWIVPRANYRSAQIVWEFQHMERMPSTQKNLFLTPLDRGKPDYVLYTSLFDGETGTMDEVLLQDYEDGRPTSLIEAEKAVWSGELWIFYQGRIYYLREGEKVPVMEFNEYRARQVDYNPGQISRASKKPDDMTMGELREYIEMRRGQGRDVNRELVALHYRIAIPFACFIFALLAASLGIQPQRSGGSATGMGLSVVIIFIYYSLMTVGKAFGEQGAIHPFLGAWIQNIIFLVIGGIMLYRVGR